MDENESYTPEDLEKCSYRYLQQVAKTMKLPANVKKIYLIKMIHAKKYSSTTDFQNIVDNVCHERKKVKQMRKTESKKKTKVQGKEVTSTSQYSPPSIASSQHTGHIVIRCPETSRRSALKSMPLPTDRVLRSTGREPGKYRFLNTVIGVIKSHNKSSNTQTHTITSQGSRCLKERSKFVINKFKTNILNCNKSMLINEGKTQLQIVAKRSGPVTSTPLPAKHIRTINGLYAINPSVIEPQLSYTSMKTINFRRQDGTLSRINVSQPNFNTSFENFVENKKQNQVTVTVQDIINSNIEEQIFSNTNMTEFMITDSEQCRSTDYPNMSMVTETATFINQPSIVMENAVLNQNIKKISSLSKERQSLRIEITKPKVATYTAGDELKNLLLMNQPECFNNNQQKTYQNEPSFVINQSKYPKLQLNIPQTNCNTVVLNCSLPQPNTNLTNTSCNITKQSFTENQSMLDNNDSCNFSVYYHKKIRAEQLRSKRNIFQRESSREDSLPKISHVFSKFNNTDRNCTQPVNMQVSDESEKTFNYPEFMAKPNNTSILEALYNFKNSFITNEPLLKVVTTSNTKCVYSTPLISTPIAQASLAEQNHFTSDVQDSQLDFADSRGDMPRFDDCLLDEQNDSIREYGHDISDLSSSNDSLADPSVTIPEMVEDALELISQDGDYMERINMDVRMQCFLCNWAGPRIILDCHVRKEHPIQTISLNESTRVVFTLTSIRNIWNSRVLEKNEQLYVISAKWEDNCLFATLTTISSLTSKSGSITYFNRVTLEHVKWEGYIRDLDSNMPYENHNDGLLLNYGNTDVFENNTALNECFFTFFVKVLN